MTASRHSDDRLRRLFAAREAADVKALVEGLRDPDHRRLAARFLAESGMAEAAPQIVRLLDAGDPAVRAAGIRALRDLNYVDAAPRLEDLARTDPALNVRCWAAGSLGRLGGKASLPVLLDLLADSSPEVRRNAALALGELGDSQALEGLAEAKRRDGLFRRGHYRKAIRAIRKDARA